MTRASRVFLGFSVAAWLPYGLYCFFQPDGLAEIAGVASTTTTGGIELQAMYGGLQSALGLLALGGLLRAPWERNALAGLLAATAGLGIARLLAAFGAAEFSLYTAIALVFEWGSMTTAAWLLARRNDAVAREA